MGGYFSQAGSFLISTIIGLYVIIVLLRFLLQVVRADFYNPLSQFVVKVTNPLLVPMRRFIPGLLGYDLSSLVLAYVLEVIELSLIGLINNMNFMIIGVFWVAIGQVISLILYIYLIAIIIQAILSWVSPGVNHPMSSLIYQLVEPIIRPVRRYIPPFSGIDLSPLVVIIVLNLLIMLIPFIF